MKNLDRLKPKLWLSRIGWLIFIWGASVLALGVVAFMLRVLMAAAGMHH